MPKYSTKQRKALVSFLSRHADEALCVKQIAEELASEEVSASAVYRNLAELEAQGRVQRLSREGSRKVYYRYVDAKGCQNHLHLSCSRCGKTVHVDELATHRLAESIAAGTDFEIDQSSCVLYGTCKACRESKRRALV